LLEFTARYYLAPLGEVVAAMLPPALRRRKREPRSKGRGEEGGTVPAGPLPELTEGQRAALEAVPRDGFSATLLHGITGSGKTEVYLRLVAECLAQGRQALLLVPEIALTPQLTERVHARFPSARIVCLHSEAPAGERSAAFVAAMRGEIDWQVHQARDPQLALAQNAYPSMGRQRWEIGMAVHESNRQLAYAVEEALEGLIRDVRCKPSTAITVCSTKCPKCTNRSRR